MGQKCRTEKRSQWDKNVAQKNDLYATKATKTRKCFAFTSFLYNILLEYRHSKSNTPICLCSCIITSTIYI